jgi:hypothetical protein
MFGFPRISFNKIRDGKNYEQHQAIRRDTDIKI